MLAARTTAAMLSIARAAAENESAHAVSAASLPERRPFAGADGKQTVKSGSACRVKMDWLPAVVWPLGYSVHRMAARAR